MAHAHSPWIIVGLGTLPLAAMAIMPLEIHDSHGMSRPVSVRPFVRTLGTPELHPHAVAPGVVVRHEGEIRDPMVIDHAAVARTRADLNGDGVVDGRDLKQLLDDWGPCNGTSDLNRDGMVDDADLARLLPYVTGPR